ncbi:hypothetical protein KY289_010698 [Solanum tuberosum]|nr:hypothetical protein KY289_010698 [Solanum tuberosum]
MDELTYGLDARAAAIIVRTVTKTVDTTRTVTNIVLSVNMGTVQILLMERMVSFFHLAAALMVGTIFRKVGCKRETSSDLTSIIGAMYTAVLFVGINNYSTVISKIPYIIIQTTYYTLIVYTMVGFELTATKFFWFYLVTFFSFLYFMYYGMMTVAITPNHHVASIFAALSSHFSISSQVSSSPDQIPKWWIGYYWICLVAWTVNGCIVSQYGDVEDTIKVPGMSIDPKIKDYIIDHFGYNPNFMGLVATVLVSFAVFYAFVYSYSIKTLNFQRR